MTADGSSRATGSPACPLPAHAYPRVVMGHGSGGRLGADLLRDVFLAELGPPPGGILEDQAVLECGAERIAITTDAFVVHPIVFPGGDIGRLAVHGTINDLAVGGARPVALAASFILEEGLPLDDLRQIVASMREACAAVGVPVVTGDTKVVERGHGDGAFITTTGIGRVPPGRRLSIAGARPGDRILLSGTIGDHGIAILSAREGLDLDPPIESDTAPLANLCEALIERCPSMRCMRDPTRGGVASTLVELATASSVAVHIRENALPLRAGVRGACELLGLDPLYVANEGKVVAVVPGAEADAALDVMRAHPSGRDAAIVGEVRAGPPGEVTMQTVIGGTRAVVMLAGDQLPRIC